MRAATFETKHRRKMVWLSIWQTSGILSRSHFRTYAVLAQASDNLKLTLSLVITSGSALQDGHCRATARLPKRSIFRPRMGSTALFVARGSEIYPWRQTVLSPVSGRCSTTSKLRHCVKDTSVFVDSACTLRYSESDTRALASQLGFP